MSSKTTIIWLKVASAILIAFGLSGLFGAAAPSSAYPAFMADLAFYPLDGAPRNNSPEIGLLWAIAGGLMTGWGLMFWQITTHLYPRDPALARQLILSGILAWFVVDSTGSVLTGAPMNALFNVGFLLLFVVPVLWTEHRKVNDAHNA
ncbi:MAG: hypothetical protein ABJN26_26070 [Stappiaceae bacterium]